MNKQDTISAALHLQHDAGLNIPGTIHNVTQPYVIRSHEVAFGLEIFPTERINIYVNIPKFGIFTVFMI